ncbi:MAG: M48 family metalloprotease, partial [Burkholderiaceae bacterium]
PDLPWTFGVLNDAGFNAFATPGGYIFVTKGLVARMHSEAELAGVLAHEIGHVLRKHHLHAAQKAAGFSAVSDLFNAANNGGSEKAKEVIVNLTRKLYTSGLDKDDEFEADRMGVVIAARAGYDAYGLPAVLQALQAQSAQDADFALLFKTHPAPAARIDMLNKLMQNKFDGLQGSTGKPVKDRLSEFGK